MSRHTHPSPPTRLTWLGGQLLALLGMLLALGALALPGWRLLNPLQPDAPLPVDEPDLPILLPETPLREDAPGVSSEVTAAPVPTLEAPVARPQTHPPAQLVIPAIELDVPVVPVGWTAVELNGETYGQWQVPDELAAGWHDTSAGVGQAGNTVLNGHHNRYGQVFGRLIDLKAGDEIRLSGDGITRAYVVTSTATLPEHGQPIEVRLANAARILPTDDERLTLVTCWPYSGNSHRLVVVAEPNIAYFLNLLDW